MAEKEETGKFSGAGIDMQDLRQVVDEAHRGSKVLFGENGDEGAIIIDALLNAALDAQMLRALGESEVRYIEGKVQSLLMLAKQDIERREEERRVQQATELFEKILLQPIMRFLRGDLFEMQVRIRVAEAIREFAGKINDERLLSILFIDLCSENAARLFQEHYAMDAKARDACDEFKRLMENAMTSTATSPSKAVSDVRLAPVTRQAREPEPQRDEKKFVVDGAKSESVSPKSLEQGEVSDGPALDIATFFEEHARNTE